MAAIEITKASGMSYCRGGDKGCLCRYPKKIPKGETTLRISIYGAGGSAVAFYCEVCMMPLLEDCKKVLDNI